MRSSDGRESTSPTAPSSSWWVISTTVRRKFGSTSDGDEIRSLPASDSTCTASHSSRAQCGDARHRGRDTGELEPRQPLPEHHAGEEERHHGEERTEHGDEGEEPVLGCEREQRVRGHVAQPHGGDGYEPAPPDPQRLAHPECDQEQDAERADPCADERRERTPLAAAE